MSTRRQQADRPTWASLRCIAPNCLEYEDPNYRVGLCIKHADWVRRTMNNHDQERADAKAVCQAEDEAEKDATAAKINAGERVPLAGPNTPGWVYYLLIDDAIKIGYTSNMRSRMRQYPPTAQLLAVEPGTKVIEKRRHNHFAAHLAHGREWFRNDPELHTWIATVVNEYGTPDHMAYTYRTPGQAPAPKQVVFPKGYRGRKNAA